MRPAVLVVFVDALGPAEADLLRAAGLALPYAASLAGVLGYSSGAIPTILTGQAPSAHGRMCLFSRATAASPLAPLRWLGLLPRVVHERGRVRRAAASLLARWHGMDGYLALHRVPPHLMPTLDVPERDDLFRAASIGGAPTFLAAAREAGLTVTVSDWRLPEARRIELLEEEGASSDLVFFYLSGLDAILHDDGAVGPRAEAWARRATAWIERARRAVAGPPGRSREVRMLVVGDHGMARVDDVIDPRPALARLEAIDPRAFVFVDSTMLRVGVRGEREDAAVRAALAPIPGELLDAEGLRARGAVTDGTYGDLVKLLPEGAIFAPSFLGGRIAGMHGYDVTSRSSRAALLSDEPLPASVTRLQDVAPLVLRALELDAVAA